MTLYEHFSNNIHSLKDKNMANIKDQGPLSQNLIIHISYYFIKKKKVQLGDIIFKKAAIN